MTMEALVQKAIEVREKAYAPYSGFFVGAAAENEHGQVFTGCNVENVSFGATCCAERTAIFKAVSEGSKKITKMAVVSQSKDYCLPCGICRQVMIEFAMPDFVLAAAASNGSYQVFSLDDLLPHAFKKL